MDVCLWRGTERERERERERDRVRQRARKTETKREADRGGTNTKRDSQRWRGSVYLSKKVMFHMLACSAVLQNVLSHSLSFSQAGSVSGNK